MVSTRRLISALALAVLGALVWAVAPALSTTPNVPAAVDLSPPVPNSVQLPEPPARAAAAADDHARYRLDGRDIYVDLPITPWEGALGGSVPVDTPGGEATVKVPRGTSTGRRLRLRGRGLPNPKGKPGDLFAEAKVVVPRDLTKEEERLFEELAGTSKFDPRRHA